MRGFKVYVSIFVVQNLLVLFGTLKSIALNFGLSRCDCTTFKERFFLNYKNIFSQFSS